MEAGLKQNKKVARKAASVSFKIMTDNLLESINRKIETSIINSKSNPVLKFHRLSFTCKNKQQLARTQNYKQHNRPIPTPLCFQ